MRWLLLAAVLSGCVFDQMGHHLAGQIIACDAARWGTREEAIRFTMEFAAAREEFQHPGSCHEGCRQDLATWRRGAEHGAACVR